MDCDHKGLGTWTGIDGARAAGDRPRLGPAARAAAAEEAQQRGAHLCLAEMRMLPLTRTRAAPPRFAFFCRLESSKAGRRRAHPLTALRRGGRAAAHAVVLPLSIEHALLDEKPEPKDVRPQRRQQLVLIRIGHHGGTDHVTPHEQQ